MLGKLVAEDGLTFVCEEPGYLDIEYSLGKTSSPLALGDVVDPGTIGIADPDKDLLTKIAVGTDTGWAPNVYTVSFRNAEGQLEPVEKVYPRKRVGEHLVDLSDRSVDGVLRIRLEWTKRILLDALPYMHTEKLEPVVTRLTLASAVHSSDGTVTTNLSRLTADRVVLEPGEQIELTYRAQPPPDSMVRVLAFIAKGKYETLTYLTDTASVVPVDGLTLDQNYPNPFNPTTTFSFALPRAADVKLEVYNVLGMRVATLVDGRLEAGRHSREWSGRNADGQLVASGVYFARLTAGEFTATKKMVVVK